MKVFECMDGEKPICYLSGEGKREGDEDSITRGHGSISEGEREGKELYETTCGSDEHD
jgi:hypothetical protein